MPKVDLRVVRTKEAIRSTFIQMITEMDYEQITIKGLTERAKINRKTFYLHYNILDDLLIEIQDELSHKYLERVAMFKYPQDLDKITREFFIFSAEQGEFYERITCSGNYQYIRQRMVNKVMQPRWTEVNTSIINNKDEQNIFMLFVTASTIEIYKKWIAEGKQMPLEQIISIAVTLVCHGAYGYMNKINIPT